MEKFLNQRNPILPLKYHFPDNEAHFSKSGKASGDFSYCRIINIRITDSQARENMLC